MKKILYPALQRGFQNHGWLKAAHSFSFANYYDPKKMHFGLLRVLNDDIVAPGRGFGAHGHDNMEIVTIPLKGSLAHKDSLGSEGVIRPGEIQIMSAGSGIQHSEFNASATEEVNLLQIWVFPKERNIKPRYDQKKFDEKSFQNTFFTVVSPVKDTEAMWINQDAYFSLGNFAEDSLQNYTLKNPGNGAFVFIIEGNALIDGERLSKRDAAGIYDTESFEINAERGAKILIIEIPMD
ncbi:pirin family protein [Rubrolithibacter danxiaensis]|uniref:pirin family protein n=1 Tax=Rubrolithibacter danxiaensis TaxID=3390805 RepID=UPI003BF90C59